MTERNCRSRINLLKMPFDALDGNRYAVPRNGQKSRIVREEPQT